jgi:hypothetical protein
MKEIAAHVRKALTINTTQSHGFLNSGGQNRDSQIVPKTIPIAMARNIKTPVCAEGKTNAELNLFIIS